MWSPFVLSKQTESQLADFTQLFFGQALRVAAYSHRSFTKGLIGTVLYFNKYNVFRSGRKRLDR
ncbi:hypothetical protein ELH98_14395 [Rhizobium ruizarguesonis]|uniref:Uncharacterized protein n=1 Tax=Rhizobium ruizarguesonis TaxID=2081791 RepID=A0ABY1XAP9_9HYPH|nr:hypothetical protein ELH98_14395 [Rhizobium ruizarguesonis]